MAGSRYQTEIFEKAAECVRDIELHMKGKILGNHKSKKQGLSELKMLLQNEKIPTDKDIIQKFKEVFQTVKKARPLEHSFFLNRIDKFLTEADRIIAEEALRGDRERARQARERIAGEQTNAGGSREAAENGAELEKERKIREKLQELKKARQVANIKSEPAKEAQERALREPEAAQEFQERSKWEAEREVRLQTFSFLKPEQTTLETEQKIYVSIKGVDGEDYTKNKIGLSAWIIREDQLKFEIAKALQGQGLQIRTEDIGTVIYAGKPLTDEVLEAKLGEVLSNSGATLFADIKRVEHQPTPGSRKP